MVCASESAKGTYVLLLHLSRGQHIVVGRKGTFYFPCGWYAYVGSALGPGGLRARLARHACSDKRLHWHIDYLTAHSTLEACWEVQSGHRHECSWAEAIQELPASRVQVTGFGASDCRCGAHLLHFAHRPLDEEIEATLRKATPGERLVRHAASFG